MQIIFQRNKLFRYLNDILKLFRLDIAQYAENGDKPKIGAIFDSISAWLNDKNRWFILNHVDPNGRQLRYVNSFEWLSNAGVALPCYNVTAPEASSQLNEKHNLFKLFFGDVGLRCVACLEHVQFGSPQGKLEINIGSILENAMAQQLKCNGPQLHYFDAKMYGELDFILQNGFRIEYMEVKSGNDYKKHAILDKIRKVEEWNPQRAYMFCKGNLEEKKRCNLSSVVSDHVPEAGCSAEGIDI